MQKLLLVLSLVCTLFAIEATGSSAGTEEATEALLDRVVATVNGDIITWSEIHESKALDPSSTNDSDGKILQNLIERKLLLQESERMDIRVSKDEVNQAVSEVQSKYAMTDREFEAALLKQGITFDRYRKRMREEIQITRYLHHELRANIVVPETELEQALQIQGIAPEGIEEIRLRMILLPLGPDRSLDDAMELGRNIKKRIRQGEKFEDLAREFSDASSSDGGGDVGYVRRDALRPEIAKVAFSLEPGTIGDPFQVGNAVYVLRVDGRRMNDETYRRERAAILAKKTDAIFREKYEEKLRELRRNASIEFSH